MQMRLSQPTVSVLATTALALTLAVTGCSNPAEGKPEAEVGEAKEVTQTDAPAQSFALTDASKISWVGSKVTGSHDGGFNAFTGEIQWREAIETSTVVIDIDATSLWSDNDGLTKHLLGGDFFETETYPTARFESTSIAKTPNGYDVTGNLEMKGVTKSVTFPATIVHDGTQITANAEFSIMRFDWGIEYKGRADDLIRDEVVIKFELVAAPA